MQPRVELCTDLIFRSGESGPREHRNKRQVENDEQPAVLLSHLVTETGVNRGLFTNS